MTRLLPTCAQLGCASYRPRMLYLTQPSPAVETFLPSARGRSSISKSDFDSLSRIGSIMHEPDEFFDSERGDPIDEADR